MAALVPDKNNLFINPYNFVSTTSRVDRTTPSQGNKTGYINRLFLSGTSAAIMLPPYL